MKITKPLYFNEKNLISNLLFPFTIINISINFFKNFLKKKKIQNKDYMCRKYLYWWHWKNIFMYTNK